ncbi:hypothetical protein [Paraburkholderia unamae]|uniref:hypothetical protein n=1 Tax=Paraburkholderia unamae TaxID=219649 RepID=UPI001CC494AC|nr:hypothetical protein [Paraburkholderia unamae]
MEYLQFAGYLLAAMVVLSLFALADWSARNNLPSMLQDEFEKVIAGYGTARNSPACADRNRDPFAVYPRRAQRVEESA